MSKTSTRSKTPHRGAHLVGMLSIAILTILIANANSPLGHARFTGTHDLLPSGCFEAGERIVSMILHVGDYVSRLYEFAICSTSLLAHINQELEQTSSPDITGAENEGVILKRQADSKLKTHEPVSARQWVRQRVIHSLTSLCEKVVRSAVGIHLPTHTTTLGLVYPAAIRTIQYVEPAPSLGTA